MRAREIRGIEFEAMVLGRHLAPANPAGADDRHLDRSTYTLLSRLELQGPMSIGQLGDAFGLDASTLNRQTSRLMKRGLLRRIPDPDGGIARKFELTDEGAERLHHERAVKLDGITEILADWDTDDVETLSALLRRFNHDIELRDGRPWPRRT